MAKRRKYKRSSKCPEPFNILIDIAGWIAMNAIANKMEKSTIIRRKAKSIPIKCLLSKLGHAALIQRKILLEQVLSSELLALLMRNQIRHIRSTR